MEKYFSNDQERLFDLIEEKELADLTAEERTFVQGFITLDDYALQRLMLSEAQELNADIPEPAPLIIPAAPSAKRLGGRTVPLYQALTAVAATVALFLSLWPYDQAKNTAKPVQLTKTDTVYRTKIIVDTVIRYIESRERQVASSPSDRQPDVLVQAAQQRVLDAGPVPLPEITEELIRTKGSSLKEDEQTKGVLSRVYQSTVW